MKKSSEIFKFVKLHHLLNFLKIYIHFSVNQTLLPVMVWIHGGGFFAGSASPAFYGPEHLLDHDIILVSINYRVGPLSFLTLENDELPGNLALRDQILALEWIQESIKYFGGDPDKVTIAGEWDFICGIYLSLESYKTQSLK